MVEVEAREKETIEQIQKTDEEDIEIPENLGLRVGTKDLVIWEDMRKATLVNIENHEKVLIVDKALLKLCDKKIAEEKKKMDT